MLTPPALETTTDSALMMPGTSAMRRFRMPPASTATAMRRLSMSSSTSTMRRFQMPSTSATTAAAMLERLRLLLRFTLAHKCLRLILLAAHEFRRLLLMTILDLPPLTACTPGFRCGFLTLLFLQMLTFECLRLRVMLSL